MTTKCAWCNRVMFAEFPFEKISHGCCGECKAKFFTPGIDFDWLKDAREEIRVVQQTIRQAERVKTACRIWKDWETNRFIAEMW